MSILCPTLQSLLHLGFEERTPKYGMPTVGYHFELLDLTASDGINRHFQPVVLLNGILNAGRVIAIIESEMPRDLTDAEAAAAWTSYSLRSHERELSPLPDWMIEGRNYWDVIPFVREARAYENRPCCKVDREYARVMREKLREQLSRCSLSDTVTFSFDGRVLTLGIGGNDIEVVAKGEAWPNVYGVNLCADTKLPARFSSPYVEISFHEGKLIFENYRYDAKEIRS